MLSQVLVWSHDIGRMTSVSTGHCYDSECMRNEYYKVKMFSNARKYWKFHNKISLAKFYSVKLQLIIYRFLRMVLTTQISWTAKVAVGLLWTCTSRFILISSELEWCETKCVNGTSCLHLILLRFWFNGIHIFEASYKTLATWVTKNLS